MLLFALVIPLQTASQESPTQTPVPKSSEMSTYSLCYFSEVYQQDGWRMPGVVGAAPKGIRMSLTNIPGVFVTDLKAGKSDLKWTILACSRDIPGRLLARPKPVRVLKMERYDFKGKVFAYEADYEPQIVEDGVPHRTLEFVPVIFYDIDGSGLFRVMRYRRIVPPWSLEVPEWAKKSSP